MRAGGRVCFRSDGLKSCDIKKLYRTLVGRDGVDV